jgi:hypothetical protein
LVIPKISTQGDKIWLLVDEVRRIAPQPRLLKSLQGGVA